MHIIVHYRAYSGTGYKKEIGNVNLAFQLFLAQGVSVLVDKAKWPHISYHWQLGLPIISAPEQKIIKPTKQNQECPAIKQPLFSVCHLGQSYLMEGVIYLSLQHCYNNFKQEREFSDGFF